MNVIVTKIAKLTKTLLNQMPIAGSRVLKCGIVHGYILNCIKDNRKAMLIEFDEEYYIISMLYTKGETSMYRKIGKWTSQWKFKSDIECANTWHLYRKCLNEATTHIYI